MAELSKGMPSPQSFGVAGVLSAQARIYYESLFDLRHLGRVSDLLAAQLRKRAPDELRLRALLLFAAVHSYRMNRITERNPDELDIPITIECGIDAESLAIGVTFSWPTEKPFDAQGMIEQLYSIRLQSDRVLLRHESKTLRTEIVALASLDSGARPAAASIEVVMIQSAEKTPKPAEYVALGDLDYAKLLQQEFRLKKSEPFDSGDVEIRIKGAREEKAQETKITAAQQIADELVRVRGSFDVPEAPDGSVLVRGSRSEREPDSGAKKGLRGLFGKFRDMRKKGEDDSAPPGRWQPRSDSGSELIEERKRLRELLAKAGLNERKRETEFHRQEELHQEEIRKKDIQIQQANLNLAMLREELGQARSRAAVSSELTELESKYQRSQKLIDELRRANSQLSQLAKMHKDKSAAPGGNVEDLRKRLEGASQMAVLYKRESEKLQARIGKMAADEKMLREELEKTKAELDKANLIKTTAKKLRAGIKPGGSGSSAA